MVNKKGWIKIVEALVSILLLIGIILIVISYQTSIKEPHPTIEEKELEILNNIEINQTFRSEILLETTIPINSTDNNFPTALKNYLNESTPEALNCTLKICATNSTCLYENNFDEDVFAKEILIIANKDIYNPRILKIFCYRK